MGVSILSFAWRPSLLIGFWTSDVVFVFRYCEIVCGIALIVLFRTVSYIVLFMVFRDTVLFCIAPKRIACSRIASSGLVFFCTALYGIEYFSVSHFLHLRLVWRFDLYFSVPERLANP